MEFNLINIVNNWRNKYGQQFWAQANEPGVIVPVNQGRQKRMEVLVTQPPLSDKTANFLPCLLLFRFLKDLFFY